MYEVHQKREQEQALLPPAVRDMMKQLAGGMKMLEMVRNEADYL